MWQYRHKATTKHKVMKTQSAGLASCLENTYHESDEATEVEGALCNCSPDLKIAGVNP